MLLIESCVEGKKFIFHPSGDAVVFIKPKFFSDYNGWYVEVKFVHNENIEIVKLSDLREAER